MINLGTNDMSYVLEYTDRREEYIRGYVEFLKKIRSRNPKARILCVLGIMGTALCPAVEAEVFQLLSHFIARSFNICQPSLSA